MWKIQSILFPTDFSKNSEAPLDYVKELAGRYKSRIIVLHAIAGLEEVANFPYPEGSVRALRKERIRLALNKLKAYTKKSLKGSRRVSLVVTEGIPYRAIVETAKKKRPSIIIMGTHGNGGFKGFLMGSNAERVVKAAPCPVLTVKGKA